ncbi:hypothetical protein EKM01_04385 [Flavobacterium sp. RSP46]|nr:hypothetical protein EKM01_04385 [Flavobacterium sp. RSP46]
MRTENKRLCIYPKDIQRITGKSYRQSVRLMLKIRTELNKHVNEFVSIEVDMQIKPAVLVKQHF